MRTLLLLAALLIPASAHAQQTGRHFLRTPRTVTTPAASPAVDASANRTAGARVEPLRRLHTGRAWSLFHYARRPITPATTGPAAEATTRVEMRRTAFWGRRLPR